MMRQNAETLSNERCTLSRADEASLVVTNCVMVRSHPNDRAHH